MTWLELGLAFGRAALLVGLVILLYPPLAWLERWVSLSPGERERLGEHPLLPVTDAMKLLSKRAPFLDVRDRLVHAAAPLVSITIGLFALAQVPPAPAVAGADHAAVALSAMGGTGDAAIAVGLLCLSPLPLLLSGWAGGHHLAMLGAFRLALVRLSSLVVVAICTLGVARFFKTTSLDLMVERQLQPLLGGAPALGLFVNPLGFGAALVAVAVLSQRGQRTRPGRNPDLIAPYAVAARGPTLLAHRLADVVDLLAVSALLASVFFGGWGLPGLDVNGTAELDAAAARLALFATKLLLTAAAILFMRRALPPLRHDQGLRLVWTVLLPVAVAGFAAAMAMASLLDVAA